MAIIVVIHVLYRDTECTQDNSYKRCGHCVCILYIMLERKNLATLPVKYLQQTHDFVFAAET